MEGLISTGIIVGWALFIIWLEHKIPYREQKLLREGLFNDFAMYTIIQSAVLGLVIWGFIDWMDTLTGWSQKGWVSDWPIWVQCLFFLVVHDLYIFVMHYFQHKNKYLWRLHEAHHSVTEMDWVAGSRSHPLEILLNQTVEFLPIVLLGASPFVILFKSVIDAVWGMWIHANVNVNTGWLQYIINGPEMHRWHHSNALGRKSLNYATKFAFWDWICGTGYLPQDKKVEAYGLSGGDFPIRLPHKELPENPSGQDRLAYFLDLARSEAIVYWLQTKALFRPFRRSP